MSHRLFANNGFNIILLALAVLATIIYKLVFLYLKINRKFTSKCLRFAHNLQKSAVIHCTNLGFVDVIFFGTYALTYQDFTIDDQLTEWMNRGLGFTIISYLSFHTCSTLKKCKDRYRSLKSVGNDTLKLANQRDSSVSTQYAKQSSQPITLKDAEFQTKSINNSEFAIQKSLLTSINQTNAKAILGTIFEGRIIIYMTSIVSCQSNLALLLIILLLPILCMQIVHIVSVAIRRPFTSWLDYLESVLVEISLICYAISVVCAYLGKQSLALDSVVIFLLLLTIISQAVVATKEFIFGFIAITCRRRKLANGASELSSKVSPSPKDYQRVMKKPLRLLCQSTDLPVAKLPHKLSDTQQPSSTHTISSSRLFPECSSGRQRLGKPSPIRLRVQAKAP